MATPSTDMNTDVSSSQSLTSLPSGSKVMDKTVGRDLNLSYLLSNGSSLPGPSNLDQGVHDLNRLWEEVKQMLVCQMAQIHTWQVQEPSKDASSSSRSSALDQGMDNLNKLWREVQHILERQVAHINVKLMQDPCKKDHEP